MARVALVSRNPAMSMALASTKHSVIEMRPGELDRWLTDGEDIGVDALVLDLGSPQTAGRTVGDLRAEGRWIPILLVTTSDPDWSRADVAGLPRVNILPFPVDVDRLKTAVDKVLQLPRTPPTPEPNTGAPRTPILDSVEDLDPVWPPEMLTGPESPDPEPFTALEPEKSTLPDLMAEPAEELAPGAPLGSRHTSARKLSPKPAKLQATHRRPATTRESRSQDPTTSIRLDPAEPPISSHRAAEPPEPSRSAPGPHPQTDEPVHLMLAQAEDYYTLQEIATVIVEDAVVRSRAEAGAMLIPDGDLWRVAGGVALRPLEFRLQLSGEAWIVEKVASAGKGVLVEDSDIARLDLRGTPLASRTHLMAVPVPRVRAVLVLARDRPEPFTEDSLATLASLGEESGPLLAGAIDLRTLARMLAKHIDEERFPGA